MSGITPFGAFHTIISVIAVVSGVAALVRFKEITPRNRLGLTYIVMTALTAATGLFIFHHGGFGPPHQLSIITLLVLGVGMLAARTMVFGRASRYVETIGFSATFFFHTIPGFTEPLTRLPPSAPLASGPNDPHLHALIGASFLLFLVGTGLQLRRLRASKAGPAPLSVAAGR